MSGGFICASIIYVIWQNIQQRPLNTLQTVAAQATPTGGVPSTVASSGYKDGTYTGDAVNAYYGMVQVQAVVRGGKISNVRLLQYPNDREVSIAVSNYSLPLLIQEALQIQNANVHGVSGATQTSEGFQASLSSALSKARA